jgi:uncharacterized protein (DUF58 family)
MSFADAFPGFKLKLTRWGALYIASCVILGLAAVNTGNNALMSMLALALGSYVVSGTWSRQVLASVEVRVSLPSEVFAGRATTARVELSNRSRLFPAYGLVIKDEAGGTILQHGLLGPRVTRRRSVELVFDERGWSAVGPWRLEILLPLGFFLKSKEVVPGKRILVYPRLVAYERTLEPEHGGGARVQEVFSDRGREGEVTQLRDYREGDDQRQLHWKQTARQQRPIVVDRQRAAEDPVYLVFDVRVRNPDDPVTKARFEQTVSEIATVAVSRLRRLAPVGLVLGSRVVGPVREPRQGHRLLRPLAEVEMSPMTDSDPAPILGNAYSACDAGGPR